MKYKNLYKRLYAYIDSKSKNHRFETYWDLYGDRITEEMCESYIRNIINGKPNLDGWTGFDSQRLNLEFDTPEELDIKLTLLGF